MPSTQSPLPAPVLEALHKGNLIEAIKLLRSSGIGLREAKDAIEAQARDAPAVPVFSARVAGAPLPPPVVDALERGNKIEAIRLMREHSGLGLKEAKDAVDRYDHTHAKSGLSPGQVPPSRGGTWWIAAWVIAAVMVYYLFRRMG